MSQTLPSLGIRCIKVVAVAAADPQRAARFYGATLGLEPAYEGGEAVGWQIGQVILMPKADWAAPTAEPNPRITLEVDNALATQAALQARGVTVADPVQTYDEEFLVGSFLDSEGNKLWFCSAKPAA